MTDDPLDAMKARWSYIQGFLFPWMREDIDPITEALGRLVTTLDVIGLEAFVPEPPRGPGRPPEDRRALARAFVAKAVLGVPTTSALIERLDAQARKSTQGTNSGRSRSRRVSSGRSRRTSARCSPTCPPPATSAARKTARATKRPGPYRAEQIIAERLIRIAGRQLPWPSIDAPKAVGWVEERSGLRLAESQRDAIRLALTSKALVITGGPGVGKTTVVNSILRAFSASRALACCCALRRVAPPSG